MPQGVMASFLSDGGAIMCVGVSFLVTFLFYIFVLMDIPSLVYIFDMALNDFFN